MRGAWFRMSVDFVVVGSGAGGLAGAIAAKLSGLNPLIIEKAPVWGGTSALSGGGVWIPNNPLMKRDGVADSDEEALAYLEATVGDVGPAGSLNGCRSPRVPGDHSAAEAIHVESAGAEVRVAHDGGAVGHGPDEDGGGGDADPAAAARGRLLRFGKRGVSHGGGPCG